MGLFSCTPSEWGPFVPLNIFHSINEIVSNPEEKKNPINLNLIAFLDE